MGRLGRRVSPVAMLTVITDTGAYPVPPCPPWCTLRPDHDIADPFSYDAGGLLRGHGRTWELRGRRPSAGVGIAWTEGIGGHRAGETAPSEPPGLYLYADDCDSAMTPAQARELAGLLVQAADYFEAEVS